jgi:thiopurine S-methyltransferase
MPCRGKTMHEEFWLQRWREGRTGFHSDRPSPLLERHWPALTLPAGSRVLVPLAGKSVDMLWLADHGFRVLDVELSPLAVEQFFDENALRPSIHESPAGRHHVVGGIDLVCGDMFDLDAGDLADCAGVYDRAALIALPADMRQRYARHLTRMLPAHCQMLLLTLDYDQAEMQGPPFAVGEDEVRALYGKDWKIAMLERREILSEEPGFAGRGMSALQTTAYHLGRAGLDAASSGSH